jgi:hypothetical protein
VTLATTVPAGTAMEVEGRYAVINGTTYRWGVEVQDVDGNWSAAMTLLDFRVRWAQAIYAKDVSVGASNLAFASTVTGAAARSSAAFQTATDAAGAGGSAWVEDVGLLAPTATAFIRILVRLATYTAGVNTLMSDMTLTYAGTASVPDKWLVAGTGGLILDKTQRRFGYYAAKLTAPTPGTAIYMYPWRRVSTDGVLVTPNTDYTLSMYVKTNGPLGGSGQVALMVRGGSVGGSPYDRFANPPGTTYWTADSSKAPDGWQRLMMSFHVPSNTTAVWPTVWFNPGVANQSIWVDGGKFEEGKVTSAWTPGFLGEAITLDAMGITVDAQAGGILRLRGSSGGIRDIVGLGTTGLLIGPDTRLNSPSIGVLAANDVPLSLNTHTHAAPVTTVVGAGTRNLGTATAAPLNLSSAMPFGAPSAGEDPYGFYVASPNKLKIPAGQGGLYTFDVYMTGSVPTGNPVSTLAYMVCNLICALPTSAEVIGRWDRYESAATQGGHFSVTRPFAAGEELTIEVIPRIVVGSGTRVAGWNIYKLATGIA